MSDIVKRLRGLAAIDNCQTSLEAAAEIERLRAALDDRCPVDAMDRGMSPVEAAIYHVWGERCPDFEPDCATCKAWVEFDQIERLRAALEWIAANTYGYEPNAMSDEEAKVYFANLFFAAQGKARAALTAQPAAPGGDA